jgi:hypothetical protein
MQALVEHVVPTKLRRISVALDDEAYQRLEALANSNMRSVANMAAVLIQGALFPGGRAAQVREDKRGGKREGSGRKPKLVTVDPIGEDGDRPQPAIEGGEANE